MKTRKLKWYGVLFTLFILFLYVMGTYDLFMMLGHNDAYYVSKGYGPAVHEYFTDYPLVGLVLWVVNLASGLISPVLYLMKKKVAAKVALVSGISDLLLILFGAVFRNRFTVFSPFIIGFDMGILIVTLLFAVYLFVDGKTYYGAWSTAKLSKKIK